MIQFLMHTMQWNIRIGHGDNFKGFMIDSDGNMMSFSHPKIWNRPDSLGYISEAKLLENLDNTSSKINSVSKSKLYKYNQFVDEAATGTLSEKKSVGADAGQYVYYCYFFDSDLGLYKKVILYVEGDWEYGNESAEAIQITEWMKKVYYKSD